MRSVSPQPGRYYMVVSLAVCSGPHHWVLEMNTVPLPPELAEKNQECIGRKARCKRCDTETILPEKLYDFQSTQEMGSVITFDERFRPLSRYKDQYQ